MLALLNLVAAFNGVLIGAVLLAQERFGPARTRVTLACFLLLVSTSLAVFVFLDSGQLQYSAPLGVALDVAALLTGALLLDYVATSVSERRLGYWPYAPALLYLLATLANGERFGSAADLRFIIALQVAFSALAAWIFIRARAGLPPGWSRRSENLHLPVLLAGVALLHVAQALRLLAPNNSLLYDLVPLVGALGLLSFAAYAILGSQTLRSLTAQQGPLQADAPFGHALDSVMAETRAFLDPDLSLPKLATLVQTTPVRLSTYLNEVRGINFRTYVNALRIDEAKRLLRAPGEIRTSVEAISKLSGFGSRSTFYSAFQAREGQSPQDYRGKNASGKP